MDQYLCSVSCSTTANCPPVYSTRCGDTAHLHECSLRMDAVSMMRRAALLVAVALIAPATARAQADDPIARPFRPLVAGRMELRGAVGFGQSSDNTRRNGDPPWWEARASD